MVGKTRASFLVESQSCMEEKMVFVECCQVYYCNWLFWNGSKQIKLSKFESDFLLKKTNKLGDIFLQGATVEVGKNEDKGKPNIFIVNAKRRSFVLSAPTKEDRDRWILAIKTAVQHIDIDFPDKNVPPRISQKTSQISEDNK